MSQASEEMLDAMWCLVVVGTDVEAIILLYSALIGARVRVACSFLVRYFSELLIGRGRSSNTILFF